MADAVHVLDGYYLAITLLVTVGYQLFFFAIAWALKFDKLTDFAGGTNFIVLAILTLALSTDPPTRQIVASVLLIAWAARLALFLLFRILKTGRDTRFDDKRDRFLPFLGFWVFQMLWVWAVSLPVTVLNSPAVRAFDPQPAFGSGRDIAGVVLWAVGFVIEAVSDAHKYRFKSKVQKTDKNAVCDVGFWGWSRHPNYFGEMLIQFGIFTIAVSPAATGPVTGSAFSALYATILGPILLTLLLMFVSGLPLSERPTAKKRYESGDPTSWERYSRWLHRTSILVPFPPSLYARVPVWMRRTLFLEFPMYVFDPAKHADKGRDEEAHRGNNGGSSEGRESGAAVNGDNRESGEGLVGR